MRQKKFSILCHRRLDERPFGVGQITRITQAASVSCGAVCAVNAAVDSDENQQGAARKLLAMINGRAVLVTRGEQGVLVVPKNGETATFPATARRVVDVSGAGDTLVASFVLVLVSGASIPNAARLANYTAGIVVAKYGTACVTHQQLSDVLLSRPDFHTQSKSFNSSSVLRQSVVNWRENGLVVGFTNGCFDIIHEGHIELLTQARSHCDRLIVAINSDASASKLKGQHARSNPKGRGLKSYLLLPLWML